MGLKTINLHESELTSPWADTINKAFKDMASELQEKKEAVLREKLAEHGLSINMKEEATKRFKSLAYVHDDKGGETWYYNDGSHVGLRIVTFENINVDINKSDYLSDGRVSADIKYY